MDDKELLELAARAAGIGGGWDWPRGAKKPTFWRGADGVAFQPLTDDADAFRLAVKLHLEVDVHHTGVAVRTPFGHKILVGADEVKDAYAATRRAITRAAAAIAQERGGNAEVSGDER